MKNFKAHILVVDDDDGIRQLVKQYLNQNDYLVTTAKNAEDALKKIEIVKFDLIVLLDKHGYPPTAHDDVYKDILEQAENFKKNHL